MARRLPAHAARPVTRARWRFPVIPFIAAMMAWVGMLVFIYPNVASWFSQYDQSKIIGNYYQTVSQGLDPTVETQLLEANEYNDALSSGAVLEADHRLPTGEGTSSSSLSYNEILTVGTSGLMGRVKIPGIEVDLPIYHGTSDATLLKGVGHLEGTSLPIGGEGTHSVLTAHRGLANATMFTNLNHVKVGDTFTLEILDQVLTYQVVSTKVVDPDQTESLRPEAGKDLVTLVTCTPLGINSQRILVTAERITPTPIKDVEDAGREPEIPGFPWWAVIISTVTVLAGVYVWRSGYPSRPQKPEASEER